MESQQTDTQVVIEQNQCLSRSILWQLQRDFFQQQGIEAWRQGLVPHYITSNTFIAGAYANVLFAFLQDCKNIDPAAQLDFAGLDPAQPLYIIELGAGSGRFSYALLKKLLELYQYAPQKPVPFKYIMTDLAERNVEFWQSHPALQPLVDDGVLDFACFDAAHDQELSLMVSEQTLSAGTVKNPVALVANYFFDSIPQDVFHIEKGQLSESLVTVSSPEREIDLTDPALLKHVKLSYENQPVTGDYYDDPAFNQILRNYQERLAATTIQFPVAALECCRLFRDMAGGRLLLLTGDKGIIQEEALLGQPAPGLVTHGSCFSLQVNYHAIGQYFCNQGGQMLTPAHRTASLTVAAFLLGPHPHNYTQTQLAFTGALGQFCPDDFYTLWKILEPDDDALNLTQILALLRLSGGDTKVMMRCLPALLNQVADAPAWQKRDLYRLIEQVWNLYFHLDEQHDFPFDLGRLLFKMEYFPEALAYFQYSLQRYGPNPSTAYNIALCHYRLRQMALALQWTDETLALDAGHEKARVMRIELQSANGHDH